MAIKAKELMIGNLLLSGSEVVKVWSMENPLQFTVYDENNNSYGGNYFQPIPLTEDWLIRFGFEFYGIDKFQYLNYVLSNVIDGTSDFRITALDGKWYPQIDDSVCCWYDFKYVHQLQNLYFALTGEELNLKN